MPDNRQEFIPGDPVPEDRMLGAGGPVITLGGLEVPLYPMLDILSWALLNLVLAILGGLIAITAIIRVLLNARKKKEESEENQAHFEAEEEGQEENESDKSTRKAWFIITLILGAVGVVIFILTQDMRDQMVLFNWWTIAHAILVVVSAIGLKVIIGKKKEEEPDEETSNYEYSQTSY